MSDYRINIWGEFVNHIEYKYLSEIFSDIKSGVYEEKIKKIRTLLLDGDIESSNKLKKELLGFTTSGIFYFNKSRKQENLLKYNGLVILDIDYLKNYGEVDMIFEKIIRIEETKMAFRSSSGLGIKIIVETNNNDPNKHAIVYKEVVKYYQVILGVEFDTKTCDIARLCFVSYDENAYLNLESKIFEVSENTEIKIKRPKENVDELFELKMKITVEFTEKYQKFEESNRNQFIYLLSKNCNVYGMKKDLVIDYCLVNYRETGFEEKEIRQTITDAYKNRSFEFGKWKLSLDKKILNYK
jgi:VirE N-terminal domain.